MQYIHKLGVSAEWKFIDVYDMSADGLQSVPRPVAATLFLFPLALPLQVGHRRCICVRRHICGGVLIIDWHSLFNTFYVMVMCVSYDDDCGLLFTFRIAVVAVLLSEYFAGMSYNLFWVSYLAALGNLNNQFFLSY